MLAPGLRPRSCHLTLRLSASVTAESTSEHTTHGVVLLTERQLLSPWPDLRGGWFEMTRGSEGDHDQQPLMLSGCLM